MLKFSFIELKIKGKQLIIPNSLNDNQKKGLDNCYAIYIYRSTATKQVYIGQTVHFRQRHDEHYNGQEQKFIDARFNQVIVLLSQFFNGSSLDDVESQMITYFMADNQLAKKQQIQYETSVVINRTSGNSIMDYQGREDVSTEVIIPFWEKVLVPKGWVHTSTLNELRTRALVKYSPIKQLTNEQSALIQEIVNTPDKNYVINGDAGTGKTVLLTHLVASILTQRENKKIGVVVQPNWEESASKIFKIFGMNTINLTVTTSSKIITSGESFDVIIVDEAHKLSRKGNKQLNAFNDVYKIPEYANCKSHLEILQRISKQTILMYDILQAIRPANISRETFAELTSGYTKKFLTTQFRIQAGKGKSYNSEDYINGIKYLLFKDTGLLDPKYTRFDPNFNKEVFSDYTDDAYFGYCESNPLHRLDDWLNEDLNYNPEHVNRILCGLVEPWKQKDGKNPEKFHFVEDYDGDIIKRRWNWTQADWINSYDSDVAWKKDAKEQIGSVFAVQGIDLNKVGVLIGNDLKVVDGKLEVEPKNFHNTNGIFSKEEMYDFDNQYEFKLFVLDIYYVLLTRGIDGIRLGFWKNPDFQKYMETTLDIH